MPSVREEVLQAAEALIALALPAAKRLRNKDRPTRTEPGGIVVMRDGDPGEPVAEDLSPHVCHYEHPIELEIAGFDGGSPASVDAMWQAIEARVTADRTLGGRCEWLRLLPPATDEAHGRGTDSLPWAQALLIAHYAMPG